MTNSCIMRLALCVHLFFSCAIHSVEQALNKEIGNQQAYATTPAHTQAYTAQQPLVQSYPALNPPTMFEADRTLLDQELVDLSLAIAPKEIEGIVYRLRNIANKEPICLLLVGAPGTGKTTLAQSIAQTTGRRFGLIRASLLADQYQFSAQAHLKQEIAHFVEADPRALICIDEIDELRGYKDQPSAFKALCTIIDDCSSLSPQVIFVATTNDKNIIPDALMSRFGGRVLNVVSQDINARIRVMHHYVQQITNDKVKVSLDDRFYLRFAKKTRKLSLRDIKKIFDVSVDFACARTWKNFLEPQKGPGFLQRLLHCGKQAEVQIQTNETDDTIYIIEKDLEDARYAVLADVHARTYAKIRQFSHEYGNWVFPMATSGVLGLIQVAITLTHFQIQSAQNQRFHKDQIDRSDAQLNHSKACQTQNIEVGARYHNDQITRTDIQIGQTTTGQEQLERHHTDNMMGVNAQLKLTQTGQIDANWNANMGNLLAAISNL